MAGLVGMRPRIANEAGWRIGCHPPSLDIYSSVLVMVAREVSCKQLLQQLLSRPLLYYQLRFHRRYPRLKSGLSV